MHILVVDMDQFGWITFIALAQNLTSVNCPNNGIGIHNCGHYEDAGVRCIDSSNFSSVTPSPTPTPFGKSFSAILVSKCVFSVCNSGNIRLVNGSTQFVNGSNVYEGRVELCLNNQWGTVIVCDDSLDSYDAQVVCRQLGYSANDAVAFTYPYFGNGFWFEEVNCSGSEPSVLSCSANSIDDNDQCFHPKGAGIHCINVTSVTPNPTFNWFSNIVSITNITKYTISYSISSYCVSIHYNK